MQAFLCWECHKSLFLQLHSIIIFAGNHHGHGPKEAAIPSNSSGFFMGLNNLPRSAAFSRWREEGGGAILPASDLEIGRGGCHAVVFMLIWIVI